MFSTTLKTFVRSCMMGGLTAIALTACQTTDYGKKTQVDPSETDIVLPAGLEKIKGFKIEGAEMYDEGSYHRETIKFTGGAFLYERYYHGGFHYVTEKKLTKVAKEIFEDAHDFQDVKYVRLENIGRTYYTTFKTNGGSCFFMGSSKGQRMEFATGTGSEARTLGFYCEYGDVELEEAVMTWLKKVKLKG